MNKNKIMCAMPTALFVTGIVGVFVSEVCAAKGALKAEKIIEEKHIYREKHITYTVAFDEPDEDNIEAKTVYTPLKEYIPEVIKATWKCYIPTVVTTTLTLSALIASRTLTARQIALLSSAVAGTGSLVTRYRNEIRDRLGEESLTEIDKKVAKETIEGDDTIRIHDKFTDTWFDTTKMAFVTAKYLLNQTFAMGSTAPLKMFYNIQGADIPYEFETYGWSWEDFNDGYIWIDIELVNKGDHYEMTYDYDPFEGVIQ